MNKRVKGLCCTLFLIFLLLHTAFGQTPNWQHLDLNKDGVFGISTDKAYNELLKGKNAVPVVVAVIDAGVDTLHEDLKGVLWVNPKKKKFDNGTYGWSYLGSARGNVHYDNLELTRQIRLFQQKDTGRLSGNDLLVYHAEKKSFDLKKAEAERNLQGYTGFLSVINSIARKIGKDSPSLADIRAFQPTLPGEVRVRNVLLDVLGRKDDFAGFRSELEKGITHFKAQTDYQLNLAYDPRAVVGDDYTDSRERKYGSPDVMGPDPTHGTHVSGIIAAVRNNHLGMDGVANDVRILAIRTVPDGDERDKDVANAIRYAADHGAKVINMSFGKAYSHDKKVVDGAVRYALRKDVVLVQAAGNSNEDIDSVANYPNRVYLNGKVAGAYIVVGASGMHDDSTLKAPFSNYGKASVDVFAPGVQIYSCVPGSKYDYFDGMSMGCPVVAGLAALIREYYPKLSALQVKEIILQSVVVSPYLAPYCKTGGVVNAFKALSLAATYDLSNR